MKRKKTGIGIYRNIEKWNFGKKTKQKQNGNENLHGKRMGKIRMF